MSESTDYIRLYRDARDIVHLAGLNGICCDQWYTPFTRLNPRNQWATCVWCVAYWGRR